MSENDTQYYNGYVFRSGDSIVLKKTTDPNINDYYTHENLWRRGTVIEIYFYDIGSNSIPQSLQADIIF